METENVLKGRNSQEHQWVFKALRTAYILRTVEWIYLYLYCWHGISHCNCLQTRSIVISIWLWPSQLFCLNTMCLVEKHWTLILTVGVCYTVASLLFIGFVGTGEPRIQIFNKLQLFYMHCTQKLAKPQNQINIHENASIPPSTKIDTHENKWTHSSWRSQPPNSRKALYTYAIKTQ